MKSIQKGPLSRLLHLNPQSKRVSPTTAQPPQLEVSPEQHEQKHGCKKQISLLNFKDQIPL